MHVGKESVMSALALLGGRNAKSKSSPLWLQFDEAERKALNQVLESSVWGRTGDQNPRIQAGLCALSWGATVSRSRTAPPDFGCNFELFTNRDFLELETL